MNRYRLREEEIFACCREGYELGYRTFVLQGGEDPYFTAARMEKIIRKIKGDYPDCALTLSVGEKDKATYARGRGPEPTGIFCGMRPPMRRITPLCIPEK